MLDLRSLLLLVLAGLTLPATLHATPGATEISQTSAEAAGGFPIVISAPGNYVLTSDLSVPSDTSAIVLTAHHVVIDLNGFRIAGPHPCGVAGCTTGFVNGISGLEGQGRYSTVRGGTITGFSGSCIALGQDAFVDEMYVSRCGRNGVQVSQGSLVRATRVRDTGRQGIILVGAESGYVHNVVVGSGWAVDPASTEAEGSTAELPSEAMPARSGTARRSASSISRKCRSRATSASTMDVHRATTSLLRTSCYRSARSPSTIASADTDRPSTRTQGSAAGSQTTIPMAAPHVSPTPSPTRAKPDGSLTSRTEATSR